MYSQVSGGHVIGLFLREAQFLWFQLASSHDLADDLGHVRQAAHSQSKKRSGSENIV